MSKKYGIHIITEKQNKNRIKISLKVKLLKNCKDWIKALKSKIFIKKIMKSKTK